MREIRDGDAVQCVDESGVEHNALVTACWNPNGVSYEDGKAPAINVVFVSSNKGATDQYGVQIEHLCSVSHKSMTTAPGRFWFQK